MPDHIENRFKPVFFRIEPDNVIHFKGLRRKNYPFIHFWLIYYAWVIVFTTWWTASPGTTVVFDTNLRELLHSVLLLSSAVFVIVLKKEWFLKASRIGSAALLLGLIANVVLPGQIPQILSVIWIGVFIGCVNAGILMPFIFTLNNTEKLYAVVGSNLLINLLSFLEGSSITKYLGDRIYVCFSFALLLIGLPALLFMRQKDLPPDTAAPLSSVIRPTPGRVYITLVISCTFAVLGKGIGKGLVNLAAESSMFPVLTYYAVGGVAGCLITFLIYGMSQKSTQVSLNITFGSMAIGLLFNAFVQQRPEFVIVFALLLGMGSTIGIINTYYILGVIAKKYSSMRYVRLSILFIGICGGIAGVLAGNYLNQINSAPISLLASIISATAMIIFLMLSPVLSQTLYEDSWVHDAKKKEIIDDHLPFFTKYGLTPRETEVCELLLQGHTLRQISGILAIAYPTVNTYCTAVYRKLSINSRTELLLMLQEFRRKS
jgi:DNA-binding CsgD family transcriptional regulator